MGILEKVGGAIKRAGKGIAEKIKTRQEIRGAILLVVGIIGAFMFASQFSAIINNQPWNEGTLTLGAILAGLGLGAGLALIKR